MKRRWIVGPVYDGLWFLGAPMLTLLLGIAISGTSWSTDTWTLAGEEDSLAGFFTGTIIHAHLVAVLFRSHGNAAIRRQFPLRFFVLPVALYAAIVGSVTIAILSTIVATFWDVWHSGAQTFGFARIYERNAGTPPELGRRLDFWLMQVTYMGPILAGATLMDHVDVTGALWSSAPAYVEGNARYLSYGVIGFGLGFVLVYVGFYVRMARTGDWRVPWQKVWLVASTAAVSIYSWGFNSWGEAFLIMNAFHAVQYLALVWAMEGARIAQRVRLPRRATLALFLAVTLAYGLGVQALDADLTTLWAVTMVVSIMHFYYDAFVWSVRKAEV